VGTSSTMTSCPFIGAERSWLARAYRKTALLLLQLVGLRLEARDELVEGLRERRDALFLEGPRDVAHVDADGGELLHHLVRDREVVVDGAVERAALVERLERRLRHRVDGVGADQRVDVQGGRVRG